MQELMLPADGIGDVTLSIKTSQFEENFVQ